MIGERSPDAGHKHIITGIIILVLSGFLFFLYLNFFKPVREKHDSFAMEHDSAVNPDLPESFKQEIPGTSVSFDMVAIPGGTFIMGSPPDEPYRNSNEGPQRKVRISPFYLGRTEVTWTEFMAFYEDFYNLGRQDDLNSSDPDDVDAITGPTPPWGAIDQGWGMGSRPAITMTWYAAETYCKWLSEKTGRSYRLPTEAEWEYAARGGTTGPYFFEAEPKKLDPDRFLNRIFGLDTAVINSYVVYSGNSRSMTHPPGTVMPNPFGLENMLGNVYEYCYDWYASDTYSIYPAGEIIVDPSGPLSGKERVIRGGSFNSAAREVRVAARKPTRHNAWQANDPQIPKSIWWYTDIYEVGFRVAMDPELNN
jgi:formylglycine-generating enzyme